MSDRNKTHNGRDVDGHFKVKRTDVEEILEDPKGVDYIRDDVRLGGAVADTGAQAGATGESIERMIQNNTADVDHLVGRDRDGARKAKRGARKGRNDR